MKVHRPLQKTGEIAEAAPMKLSDSSSIFSSSRTRGQAAEELLDMRQRLL